MLISPLLWKIACKLLDMKANRHLERSPDKEVLMDEMLLTFQAKGETLGHDDKRLHTCNPSE
jgi:hypothetical protein